MVASAMRTNIQTGSKPQTAPPSAWTESKEPTMMDPTSDMIVTWFAVIPALASHAARGRRACFRSGFRRFRDVAARNAARGPEWRSEATVMSEGNAMDSNERATGTGRGRLAIDRWLQAAITVLAP